MADKRALVTVIDDDQSVRESLPDLLREFGLDAESFDSAEAFLESASVGETRCLILDITMPGMSGPELQQELISRGVRIPIIFISAHADETVRTTLLDRGAVDCLVKPFSDENLRLALHTALN
jgi:FixJ family two-component response regulator